MKHYLEDLCQIFGNNAPVRLVYPGSREVLISQHRWHQQPEFVRHGQIQRTRSSIAGCHQPGCNKTFNRDSQPVHILRLSAFISLICRFNATANPRCAVQDQPSNIAIGEIASLEDWSIHFFNCWARRRCFLQSARVLSSNPR